MNRCTFSCVGSSRFLSLARIRNLQKALLLRQFQTVQDLKDYWVVHPDLDLHIQSARSADLQLPNADLDWISRDTQFSPILLGTGGGSPTQFRSNSATALKMGSKLFLFDAGEGIQLRLMQSMLQVVETEKIFSKYRLFKSRHA
jgi:hypothetical protein